MRSATRRRSALVPMASISFAADVLTSSLYSATPLQRLNKRVEGRAFFALPVGKSCKVLGVLRQRRFDGVVHHVGDRPVGGSGFQAQGAMNLAVEIDRGAFLGVHGAFWRYNVMTSRRWMAPGKSHRFDPCHLRMLYSPPRSSARW